jgi:uncharacterized protein
VMMRSPATGARVVHVPPNLDAGGLRAGDRIITFDDVPVASAALAIAALRERKPGSRVAVRWVRDEVEQTGTATIVEHPREQSDGLRIRYDHIDVDGARRRVVLASAERESVDGAPARTPAALIIGGLGCYPADSPFNRNEAQRGLAHALARAGIAALRVEKTGAGDSEGPPCADASMKVEIDGLVAGLRWLKAQPGIDPQRIAIVGLSMGGIVGPRVAAIETVSAMAFFEIVGGTSWFEYELENRRRQLGLRGMSEPEIHAAVLDRAWCMSEVMLSARPRESAIAERAACERELRYPLGDGYMREVFVQNIPQLFLALGPMPTLIVYGSADFVTSRAQGEGLAAMIERAHPGTATFQMIEGMDHWLSRAASTADSFDRAVNRGIFADKLHPEAPALLVRWLQTTFTP